MAAEREVHARSDEGVHAMRVAIRRLRSALRTFRPAFRAGSTRHLEEELRWLGGLLGAERDAQVVYGRLLGALGELAPGAVLGQPGATLVAGRDRDLDAAHATLTEALASPRYAALGVELATFAAAPPLRRGRRARRLHRRLEKAIRHCARLIKAAGQLEGERHEVALHEARKAVKHVRYAAETLRLGPGARRLGGIAKTFADLQGVLGDCHDAVVARDLLRVLAGEDRERGFSLGVLFQRQQALAVEAEARFWVLWSGVRRRRAYRRLAR